MTHLDFISRLRDTEDLRQFKSASAAHGPLVPIAVACLVLDRCRGAVLHHRKRARIQSWRFFGHDWYSLPQLEAFAAQLPDLR